MAFHRTIDGQRFCQYGGKWRCGSSLCGRWWNGFALKVQDPPATKDSFPEEFYPDCMKCDCNYDVYLEQFWISSREEGTVSDRGHQSHLCPLCKAGRACPRARFVY